MDNCECCGKVLYNPRWYLVDGNAECILCKPCAKDIRKECLTVTIIPQW